MSTIKVDTIATRTGSGNITVSNNIAASGTLAVTGASTLTGGIANAGTISAGTLGSNVVFPAGCIIQTVQTAKTDTFVGNSTSFTDITGFSVTITPKYNNSKIMIYTTMTGEVQNDTYCAQFRLLRGSTAVGIGDANGSAPRGSFHIDSYPNSATGSLSMITASFHFMDSPATTSATTYKVQGQAPSGSGNFYVGRNESDNNGSTGPGRYPSIITAMEIAQ